MSNRKLACLEELRISGSGNLFVEAEPLVFLERGVGNAIGGSIMESGEIFP